MPDNPANRGRAIPLTYDQFRYSLANTVGEDEAKQLYNEFSVEGFLGTSDEELRWALRMNFFIVLKTTRAAPPAMVDAGSGSIVNVAALATPPDRRRPDQDHRAGRSPRD